MVENRPVNENTSAANSGSYLIIVIVFMFWLVFIVSMIAIVCGPIVAILRGSTTVIFTHITPRYEYIIRLSENNGVILNAIIALVITLSSGVLFLFEWAILLPVVLFIIIRLFV